MTEKPFKTLDQQVEILSTERGLVISNREEAKKFLSDINYYRFSGYARNWQVAPLAKNNNFREGAEFRKIARIAEIDSEVRALLFAWCSEIEILVRSKLAYRLAEVNQDAATDFYLHAYSYKTNGVSLQKKVDALIENIKGDIARKHGKSFMIDHYVKSCDSELDCSELPIWVAVEVMSFGNISKMIELWRNDQTEALEKVAKSLGVSAGSFSSVIHAVSGLRNACAHHDQLWNRNADKQAPDLKSGRRERGGCSSKSHYVTIWWAKKILTKSGTSQDLDKLTTILNQNDLYRQYLLNPMFGGTNRHGEEAP